MTAEERAAAAESEARRLRAVIEQLAEANRDAWRIAEAALQEPAS